MVSLLVPLLANVTHLVLWMMDEKQTYPDSASLLSSLESSKKPACSLKDIMSVCGQSQLCLHVCVCACEAADTCTCTCTQHTVYRAVWLCAGLCLLECDPRFIKEVFWPVVQDDAKRVFLLKSLDHSTDGEVKQPSGEGCWSWETGFTLHNMLFFFFLVFQVSF